MVQNIGTHLPWIAVSSVRLGLAGVAVACVSSFDDLLPRDKNYRPLDYALPTVVVTRQHYGDAGLKQQRYGILHLHAL